jgi:hypothetical protein
MKKISKILLPAVLACLSLSSAYAQESKPAIQNQQVQQRQQLTPEQRAQRRADLLKAKLMLSDEQTEKVKEASLRLAQNRDANRDDMRKEQEAFDNALRGILNPEQIEKYEAMNEERKERIKARMEERRTEEKRQVDSPTDQKQD